MRGEGALVVLLAPGRPIFACPGLQPGAAHHFLSAWISRDTSDLSATRSAAIASRSLLGAANAMIVDLRWHYHSLPVTVDAAGAPHVPPTPRLNANAPTPRASNGIYYIEPATMDGLDSGEIIRFDPP